MATQLKMHNKSEEDDDDDLEALRLAALKTLRPKPVTAHFCPPAVSNVVHQTHRRHANPNLITIVPVGSEPDPIFKPPPRVVKNPMVRFNSNVVVLNHVQNDTYLKPAEKEEEVSTKFSRFEDTESESEDDSDTDNKGSKSSDESDADCIALQDDDSLEALMAQMEQEFGEGNETKVEKKKNKSSNKTKSKSNDEGKNENVKVEQMTAGGGAKLKDVKTNKVRPQPKSVSPVKVEVKPLTRSAIEGTLFSVSPVRLPVKTNSPGRHRSPVKSPLLCSPLRSKSPQSPLRSKSPIHSSRLKSPVRQKPLRSPQRHKSPLKSPVRLSPARRSRSPLRSYSPAVKYSTLRKSPIRRSPSPYARVRRSRSPLRKRSPSRSFLSKNKDRSPKYSPNYYSLTPPKKWCPVSPPSPVRYRSPNQFRRSVSPRRIYSRSPSPAYYSPRRRSPSPFRKKIAPRRRSLSPSSTPRRSLSPRRRSVSPLRQLSPKVDVSSERNRRKPNSPNKVKQYSPDPKSPSRRQRSVSPQRRTPPLWRRHKHDRGWNKNERPKSDTASVSLSPSPQPRDRDNVQPDSHSSRRNKSPLRVQKDNSYYNKSEKRPVSPDNRNGSGDGVKRRRGGNNWDRSGKSWDGRRTDRDRRKDRGGNSRNKKEVSKNIKTNTSDKKDVPTFPQKTNDPILEARRKKFESNDLVEPASKKIRLRNSPVKEKMVEVQTKPDVDDLEGDILDLGAELWSSDEGEPVVKHSGGPQKKKKCVKERVEEPKVKTSSTSTELLPVDMTDKASSPLTIVQEEEEVESLADKGTKDEMDSDLRAELSRRRAERLTKAGSVHKNLPARIVQSAFEGVMGKRKVKRTEKKEKECKNKEKVKTSPSPAQDIPKVTEKTDGRRVLVLKRMAPVRLPSQTAINVTFSEGDGQSSDSDSDDKYVSPLKRKLPIHMRLGVANKVRKVKLKHRNQV